MINLKLFFNNKKVFLTGHSGFKGSWISLILASMGAKVYGYSLKPQAESLYNIIKIGEVVENSMFADIRDHRKLEQEVKKFQPEIIIHMAAQPFVRASYLDPRYNYEANVIGTLNVFEAALKSGSVRAIINITTDKCYENREIDYAYKEDDKLGGYDPYSASKACAEILTSSYRNSFMRKAGIATASVRAGNVIGGGDFSVDRIIPDIFCAIRNGDDVMLRSPKAIRPWQHVLEPLSGYLMLAKNLYENGDKFAKAYNFGPQKDAEVNVENLAKEFIAKIGIGRYKINEDKNLHEAGILKLDNNLAKIELDWKPKLSFDEAILWTALWYKKYLEDKNDIKNFTLTQIKNFYEIL
ncbi:MAG TPA: CDP-glucose 4,6-dehydratase [Rickettsiales bacterium]|nr:CDP-glucose 4,6-dehydratase [Rickettsiales bacterium]